MAEEEGTVEAVENVAGAEKDGAIFEPKLVVRDKWP